jgi:hypothetical protein
MLITMRTTLDIDDDVLKLAKGHARVQRVSLGRAISTLVRKGLASSQNGGFDENDGVPTFCVSQQIPQLTVEMVKEAELF